jgi:hypothetical protein
MEVLYAPAYINIEHGFGGVIFTRAVKIYITIPPKPWGSPPVKETPPTPLFWGGFMGVYTGGLTGWPRGCLHPPPRGVCTTRHARIVETDTISDAGSFIVRDMMCDQDRIRTCISILLENGVAPYVNQLHHLIVLYVHKP